MTSASPSSGTPRWEWRPSTAARWARYAFAKSRGFAVATSMPAPTLSSEGEDERELDERGREGGERSSPPGAQACRDDSCQTCEQRLLLGRKDRYHRDLPAAPKGGSEASDQPIVAVGRVWASVARSAYDQGGSALLSGSPLQRGGDRRRHSAGPARLCRTGRPTRSASRASASAWATRNASPLPVKRS
jgi:hypothetical protein